jgi:hypothetical protein
VEDAGQARTVQSLRVRRCCEPRNAVSDMGGCRTHAVVVGLRVRGSQDNLPNGGTEVAGLSPTSFLKTAISYQPSAFSRREFGENPPSPRPKL